MAIYRLKDEQLHPFHPKQAQDGLYEKEIEDLVWGFPEEVVGESLFLVGRQQTIEGGARPDVIALDDDARVVVIEVKREFDRGQLAQTLEYAGWAQTTSLDEIAQIYQRQHGKESDFFHAWAEWGNSNVPEILNPRPRMVVVAQGFHARTKAALDFMQGSGMSVEVRTVTVHSGDGDTIIEVGGIDAPAGIAATAPAGVSGGGTQHRHFGVKLSDLVAAGLLAAGEQLRFHRPKVGDTFWATVMEGGVGLEADGKEYSSASAAAMAVTGAISYDGWWAWAAERDGEWVALRNIRKEYLAKQVEAD